MEEEQKTNQRIIYEITELKERIKKLEHLDDSKNQSKVDQQVIDQNTNDTISDIKKINQEMKKVIDDANESLKLDADSKKIFLDDMNHKIRTALNGVIGLTEIMMDTKLSSEQHRYLTMAKNSAAQLLTFMNDVLDFSKIETGQY